MILSILQLIAGIALLLLGGDRLVVGASRLAMILGISPLVVGLTIVAFGTSSPELAVTVQSILRGTADLGVGNLVGSSIFNFLVILGIAAFLQPLTVAAPLVRYEVPVLIVISAGIWQFSANGKIENTEGLTLVLILVLYLSWLVSRSRRHPEEIPSEVIEELGRPVVRSWMKGLVAALLCLLGLGLLAIGSEWTVAAAVHLARAVGVSELLIGLTIIAGGTSLPELATTVVAAFRRSADIAVGNVVGSNLLNMLAVLGPAAAFTPAGLSVHPQLLRFDIPILLGLSVLCLPIVWSGARIDRVEASLFLALYAGYIAVLAAGATQSPGAEMWMDVYVLAVLPAALLLSIVWGLLPRVFQVKAVKPTKLNPPISANSISSNLEEILSSSRPE
jgi:cation:H+ antiporter